MIIPPQRIKCPAHSGDGINDWIYRRALFLCARNIPQDEIEKAIIEETAHCNRDTTSTGEIPRQIERAVEYLASIGKGSASATPPGFKGQRRRKPPDWPPLDVAKRRRILVEHQVWTVQRWRDANEWRGTEKEALLDVFGRADRLICLGATKGRFRTDRLGVFLRQEDLATLQYIVPNPMWKVSGKTQGPRGHDSMHCKENVGRRWYLVVEFDKGTLDEQSMLHHYLSGLRRLVMLVYSGGKSIHGWYDVYGDTEVYNLEFMNEACRLGADPRLWQPWQFSRLPGGTNLGDATKPGTGKKQELIYYKAANETK